VNPIEIEERLKTSSPACPVLLTSISGEDQGRDALMQIRFCGPSWETATVFDRSQKRSILVFLIEESDSLFQDREKQKMCSFRKKTATGNEIKSGDGSISMFLGSAFHPFHEPDKEWGESEGFYSMYMMTRSQWDCFSW